MYVNCLSVQHYNSHKSVQHRPLGNNRAMDAAPAVSTLHTQGSKAWTACTEDQKKETHKKKKPITEKLAEIKEGKKKERK